MQEEVEKKKVMHLLLRTLSWYPWNVQRFPPRDDWESAFSKTFKLVKFILLFWGLSEEKGKFQVHCPGEYDDFRMSTTFLEHEEV
jgi:hypothetical protein